MLVRRYSLLQILDDDVHEFIEVYLPNSVVEDDDSEEYNTFVVTNENRDVLLTTTDIKELTEFLKQIIWNKM